MSTFWIITLGCIGGLIAGVVVALFTADDGFSAAVGGGMTFVIVALVAIGIPLAIREQNSWEHWCKSQGGHVTDHTSTTTVVTVGSNGQPGVGVGSDTTYYCLTADGRVLDVH